MTHQPLQETAPAGDSEEARLDCPHCSYETTDQPAYEVHLTLHSQANPNSTPQTGVSMTEDDLASFLVRHCKSYLAHWPINDEELEHLAQHLAGNLLDSHEVVRKTYQPRREP